MAVDATASPTKRSTWRIWLIGCGGAILLPFALMGFVWGGPWQWCRYQMVRPQIEKLLPRMDPLIAALERYHSDHGRYPGKLDALTPQYLTSLPELSSPLYGDARGIGVGYEYSTQNGGASFALFSQVSGVYDRAYQVTGMFEYVRYESPGYSLPPGEPEPYARIGRWDYYSWID